MGWAIHISLQFTVGMRNVVSSVSTHTRTKSFLKISENIRAIMEVTNILCHIKILNFKQTINKVEREVIDSKKMFSP